MARIEDLLNQHFRRISDLLSSIQVDTARLLTVMAARPAVNILPRAGAPVLASRPPGGDSGKVNLKPREEQLLYKGSKERCFVIECTEGAVFITREDRSFVTVGSLYRGGSAKVCGKHITVGAPAPASGGGPLNQGVWTLEEETEGEEERGKINVETGVFQVVYSGSEEKCFVIECTEGRLVVSLDGHALDSKIPRGASAKVCGKDILVQGDAEAGEDAPPLNQGSWTLERERRVF